MRLLILLAGLFSASLARAAEPDRATNEGAQQQRGTVLELAVGPRAVRRDFSYSDDLASLYPAQRYPKLAPFHLGLGPAVFAEAKVYPGTLVNGEALSHLGLLARYESGLATDVAFAEGTPYEQRLQTRSSSWLVAASGHLAFGSHELSLSVGYGDASYRVLGDDAAPVVPDVDYGYVRSDIEAKLVLGEPFLRLHAGTRYLLGLGEIESRWFPGASALSAEAGVGVGLSLTRSFELELGFEWLRYGFDFNPVPSSADPWNRPIAGGAVDQYLSLGLTIRYRLHG